MLCFVAKTNKEYCMINALIATMPDGRRYVFDRDTTEYSIEDNGDLFMDWYGIYLWEADDIHIDVNLFKEIINVTPNDEDGFESLFENGLEVARAVKYGDYDYTKPYVKIGNDGNLYSMDRGEYLEELRDNKDELMDAYNELVSDGVVEDFLKEEEE